MKHLLVAALTLVCLLGAFASSAAAQETITLWADNMNTNSGNVTISIDGDTLSVSYDTTDGWVMTETHIYVGTVAPTKSSPGRFPYMHEDLGGITSDNYSISLSELGLVDGGTVYISAQAALQKPMLDANGNPVLDEEGNQVYIEEGAWAEGDPLPTGKNWAMYFSLDAPAAGAAVK